MRPRTRKLLLVLHVGVSVGWLGAVVASLAVGLLGLLATDATLVRGAYLILEPVGWSTLVPFSVASLLTGLVQSLAGTWGLARHYWVVFKLLMNVLATAILLLYMRTLGTLAASAADPDTGPAGLRTASPVLHAAGAIGLLVVALVLSVYKPRGLTGYGRRLQSRHTAPVETT
ncbi:hypothetical protein Val02_49160 [Virgisporangium aliadipatigenens]|uniref:DUF2269 domain-containing protein n=1 Tax=Virgisporangium aliadipatigenens TaxID=741659 RepID=A0A8J3YQ95_9ACTN|nr:DUF2269 domain-containing protein [Virgisporangium aliadipatigenens]GIJ48030.1 hypothetical protein Val02_49160 [Virgisporangium aliadipatigenens]